MMKERGQIVGLESVKKGKQHTSSVFWHVVFLEVFWWIWNNFCYDDLLLLRVSLKIVADFCLGSSAGA